MTDVGASNKRPGYFTIINKDFAFVPTKPGHACTDKTESRVAPTSRASLPREIEDLPKVHQLPPERHRWNTNEEIAGLLSAFEHHQTWLSTHVIQTPPSGSMILYSRSKVKYSKDGYWWKKRKDGKTIREDHMKLKVRGLECIYGKYSHSVLLPTFHRRCYWLLQNPDIVLIHYMNVVSEDSKLRASLPALTDKLQVSRDQLCAQLGPMLRTELVDSDPVTEEQLLKLKMGTIVEDLLDQQSVTSPTMTSSRSPARSPNTKRNSDKNLRNLAQSGTQPTGAENAQKFGTNLPVVLNIGQLQGSNNWILLGGAQNNTPVSFVSGIQNGGQISNGSLQNNLGHVLQNQGGQIGDGHYYSCDSALRASSCDRVLPGSSYSTRALVPVRAASLAPSFPHTSVGESRGLVLGASLVKSESQIYQQSPSSTFDSQPGLQPSSQPGLQPGYHNQNFLQSKDVTLASTNYPHNDLFSEREIQETLNANLSSSQTESQNVSNPNLGFDSFDFLDFTDLDHSLDHLVESDLFGAKKLEDDEVFGGKSDCAHAQRVGDGESLAVTTVTDYSPEWAYPEGGMKLLVTGPWYSSNSTYSLVFDGESVPAELVQNGVLRCVCPAHCPGVVSFQVACDNDVISNSCTFEYKEHRTMTKSVSNNLDEQTQWLVADDKLFKLSMLERMADIEKHLFQGRDQCQDRPFQIPKIISHTGSMDVFEDCMVAYCQACSKLRWIKGTHIHTQSSHTSHKGMTLLHLAAALGYVQLIKTLISWRQTKPSAVLDYEVDALSLDDNSCTPFFWACALNKREVAVLLYEFNPSALNVCTRDGTLPLTIAKFKCHTDLVSTIEHMEISVKTEILVSTPKYKERKRGEKLRKRLSMELFPQCQVPELDVEEITEKKPLRSVNSHPTLTSLVSEDMTSSAVVTSSIQFDSCDVFMHPEPPQDLPLMEVVRLTTQAMDTDEVMASIVRCESPYIDVEKLSSDDDETPTGNAPNSQTDDSSSSSSSQNQMVTLAKQIIAAMPERIKLSPSRSDDSGIVRDRSSSYGSRSSVASVSTTPPCNDDSGLNIETFHEYRYSELSTPASSLSPVSSSCIHSPLSFTLDSPPPTTSEFQEYFNAPSTYMEKDFSQLTLSDQEQRRLYEAAKIIQNFYRRYKDRQQQQLQRKNTEMEAAVLIQSYYRRYKEYAYYKKMCQAAVLIQSQFRSYQLHKQFKRSRDAATIIQNQYRAYKQYERFKKSRDAAKIIQQRFRSHYQRFSVGDKSRKKTSHALCRQSSHGSEKESGMDKSDKTATDVDANEEAEPESETSNQEREKIPDDMTSHPDKPIRDEDT